MFGFLLRIELKFDIKDVILASWSTIAHKLLCNSYALMS